MSTAAAEIENPVEEVKDELELAKEMGYNLGNDIAEHYIRKMFAGRDDKESQDGAKEVRWLVNKMMRLVSLEKNGVTLQTRKEAFWMWLLTARYPKLTEVLINTKTMDLQWKLLGVYEKYLIAADKSLEDLQNPKKTQVREISGMLKVLQENMTNQGKAATDSGGQRPLFQINITLPKQKEGKFKTRKDRENYIYRFFVRKCATGNNDFMEAEVVEAGE